MVQKSLDVVVVAYDAHIVMLQKTLSMVRHFMFSLFITTKNSMFFLSLNSYKHAVASKAKYCHKVIIKLLNTMIVNL